MNKLTINLTLPNGNKHEVAAPVTVDTIKQLEEAGAKNTVGPTEPFFPPEYLLMEKYFASGRPIYVNGDPEIIQKWAFSIAKKQGIPYRSSIQCSGRTSIGTHVFNQLNSVNGDCEVMFKEGDLLKAYARGETVCLVNFRQLSIICMLEVTELALKDYYTCPGYYGKTYRRHPNFRLVMIDSPKDDKWTNKPPARLINGALLIKVAYDKAHEQCLKDHEKMHDLFTRGTVSMSSERENTWEDAWVEKQPMSERR